MKPTESKQKCSVTVLAEESINKPALLRRLVPLTLFVCASRGFLRRVAGSRADDAYCDAKSCSRV
jgi:hypothetical protein